MNNKSYRENVRFTYVMQGLVLALLFITWGLSQAEGKFYDTQAIQNRLIAISTIIIVIGGLAVAIWSIFMQWWSKPREETTIS